MGMAVVGGLLIGLAAASLLVLNGRVAGISGIFGKVLEGEREPWRWAFLAGLITGGVALSFFAPAVFALPSGRSLGALAVAGFLVGVGTRIGGGCTSGHGVCGVARLSKRSIVATMTFMATGWATATGTAWIGGMG